MASTAVIQTSCQRVAPAGRRRDFALPLAGEPPGRGPQGGRRQQEQQHRADGQQRAGPRPGRSVPYSAAGRLVVRVRVEAEWPLRLLPQPSTLAAAVGAGGDSPTSAARPASCGYRRPAARRTPPPEWSAGRSGDAAGRAQDPPREVVQAPSVRRHLERTVQPVMTTRHSPWRSLAHPRRVGELRVQHRRGHRRRAAGIGLAARRPPASGRHQRRVEVIPPSSATSTIDSLPSQAGGPSPKTERINHCEDRRRMPCRPGPIWIRSGGIDCPRRPGLRWTPMMTIVVPLALPRSCRTARAALSAERGQPGRPGPRPPPWSARPR